MDASPRWTSTRRWTVLTSLVGSLVPSAFLGLLFGLLRQDAASGAVFFGVVVVVWVFPRALLWRRTLVDTLLEVDGAELAVRGRRGQVRSVVDLRDVERIEVSRGDLVPFPFVKHALSTVVVVRRDAAGEIPPAVRLHLPHPDDFDAMTTFLREAAEGSGCDVVDVTHVAAQRAARVP